jgi:glyoxylase-like metal-dependent hydrolase (beta-lactamase superfamily II)
MPQTVAETTNVGHGIVAIDTEYMRPRLDASHLIVSGGRAAFVDTGTNDSVPLLLDALRQHDLGPSDVDYLFLTHVHLDHAGGAGQLMRELPNAICILHPRGAPHMADPAKLIAGTNAVYGEAQARAMYGEILPIDAGRIVVAEDDETFSFGGREMRVLHTKGHALHHYCLYDRESSGVFTGDSFGISYREFDTDKGEFIYPTTTPPHFDPPEAHKAIDRIVGLEPSCLYLTHFSRVDDVGRLASDMHEGIDGFVAISNRHRDDGNRLEAMQASMADYLAARIRAHGYQGDDDTLRALIHWDVVLNSQGLDAWLSWMERNQ